MRGVLIYILMVVQVTLSAQSVHFSFKNYQITKIGLSESITFENSFFDENFFGYQQLNFKLKLSKEFSILSIQSEPCTSEEEKILTNWNWKPSPQIRITNGSSNGDFYSSIKVFPYFLKNGAKHKIKEIELNIQNAQNESIMDFRSDDAKQVQPFAATCPT